MESFLLVPIIALLISTALIPAAIRLAPALGMLDEPDPRKVHFKPVPRIGGVGIVVGALLAMVIWLPMDRLLQSYVMGSLVLFFFGIWDDRAQLGHYVKFTGQFIAVGLVMFYGDLTVTRIPFLSPEPLPAWIGIPSTFIAMVGVINAINHSDGLDGLASGEALVSLLAIALLAYQADGSAALLVALAVVGSLLGFLRFNTHPAEVFMGDSGSQFLGFTLGVLVVLLTQQVNPALSPAVAILLLGLPVIDIIAVFYLRISGGMNWFRATRNHIHHRLLELGFTHQAAVVIIYSIHLAFVLSALLLPYATDGLLIALYLGGVVLIFGVIVQAEKTHSMQCGSMLPRIVRFSEAVATARRTARLGSVARKTVQWGVPAWLLINSMLAREVPSDIALSAGLLSVVLAIEIFRQRAGVSPLTRFIVYVVIAFNVFLCTIQPDAVGIPLASLRWAFVGLLAGAIALSLKSQAMAEFRTTPTDYLGLLVVLALSAMPLPTVAGIELVPLVVKSMVLFYAAELIFAVKTDQRTRIPLEFTAIVALMLISLKGYLFL